MAFYYYNWEEVIINWEDVDMLWEEVGILQDLFQPGSGIAPLGGGKLKVDLEKINKLPEEKKRVLIRLAVRIAEEEGEFVEYKYKKKSIKITAKHMNIILDKILNKVKVNVQNIS